MCGVRYNPVANCYYCGSLLFVVRARVGCAGYSMVRLLAAATAGRRYVYRCCSDLLNSIRCTTPVVSISGPVRVLLSPFFLLYYWYYYYQKYYYWKYYYSYHPSLL